MNHQRQRRRFPVRSRPAIRFAARREFHQQKFPVPPHSLHPTPRQLRLQRRRIVNEVRLPQTHLHDPPPRQRRLQSPRNSFDFRKFRHAIPLYRDGTSAKIRTGPPDPPSSLIGAATTNAPVAGSMLKFATFSS